MRFPNQKAGFHQQGSILVAVLVFSVVLSMAAASVMLIAGNSQNDEDMAFRRIRCQNDAESGLMLGIGWLRNSSTLKSFIGNNQGWAGNSITLFTMTMDNGSLVTVRVVDNAPVIPPRGPKTVVSNSVLGSESVQFSWDVDTVAGAAATDLYPVVSLSKWRSP